MSVVLLLCHGQRSAPVVKPLPRVHNAGIIRPSRLPVALAIAVLFDWVPISAHLLQLLLPQPDARLLLSQPDARLLLSLSDDRLLLLLGLLLRLAMGE